VSLTRRAGNTQWRRRRHGDIDPHSAPRHHPKHPTNTPPNKQTPTLRPTPPNPTPKPTHTPLNTQPQQTKTPRPTRRQTHSGINTPSTTPSHPGPYLNPYQHKASTKTTIEKKEQPKQEYPMQPMNVRISIRTNASEESRRTARPSRVDTHTPNKSYKHSLPSTGPNDDTPPSVIIERSRTKPISPRVNVYNT
jgi:hypothetical protein